MIFLSPPIDPVIPGIQSYQLWQRARVSRERLGSSERPNMLEGREPDTESAKWKQKHHWSNPLSDLSADWSTRLRGSSESRSEPRSWPPPPFMPRTRIAIDSFYSRRLDRRWIVLLKKTMDQSACLVLVDWLAVAHLLSVRWEWRLKRLHQPPLLTAITNLLTIQIRSFTRYLMDQSSPFRHKSPRQHLTDQWPSYSHWTLHKFNSMDPSPTQNIKVVCRFCKDKLFLEFKQFKKIIFHNRKIFSNF